MWCVWMGSGGVVVDEPVVNSAPLMVAAACYFFGSSSSRSGKIDEANTSADMVFCLECARLVGVCVGMCLCHVETLKHPPAWITSWTVRTKEATDLPD